VHLKRFFGDGVRGDYLFLVDEAHNLVDRGREMYSASLSKEDFLAMKKYFKMKSQTITRHLTKCNKFMLEMKRECENYCELEGIGALAFALMNLLSAMEKFFADSKQTLEHEDEILEFYFSLRHFLNMYEGLDDHYVIYTEHETGGSFRLKLFCVDPSQNLQAYLDKGKSTIFFSATLLPLPYYMGLLNTVEDSYAMYAQTVFSPKQRLLLLADDVSSKYTRRNENEFLRIASYIQHTAQAKKGNYIAFFPSCRMMEQVLEQYQTRNHTTDCLVQESGMGERQREEFLEAFDQKRENSLVAFCVMGGIFAEGIDLKADRLVGAIVVGTGLPQISNEREILKRYYDIKQTGAGFNYAFRYPGMNKVQQAAGRVIRTVEDKGVILLLDERFLQRENLEIFPREWTDFDTCKIETVKEKITDFWNLFS
jgi:Rad3-related DNA helicase